MESKVEAYLREKAKEKGMKLTPQRIAVYTELATRNDHPSAEEIYEALKEKIKGISLPTVYRNLLALETAGLVMRVPTPDGKTRFDAKTHPHAHFVCLSCGKVFDVECEFTLKNLPKDLDVWSVNLVCDGKCKECIENNDFRNSRNGKDDNR